MTTGILQHAHSPSIPSPTLPEARRKRGWKIAFFCAFLIALLLRIPFYATHHIQEDAYITFRAAFHLADSGDYSFNYGDHASGVTSTVYGPYVAVVRLLFKSQAINALSVLNTFIFLVGASLFAVSFFDQWRERVVFFLAIATLPTALVMTYTGMEVPLQAAVVGWIIFTLRRGQPSFSTCAGVLLLPLIRPDAIAYSLIFSVLAFSFNKIRGLIAIACSVLGTALVFVINRITTGHFITDTMKAKEIAYHPDHHLPAILARAKTIFLTHSYLSPVESREFAKFGAIITVIVFLGCVAAIWLARRESVTCRLLITCFAAGVLIPVAYVAGGVIFPWYLQTSSWLCAAMLCYAIIRLLSNKASPAVYGAAVALLAIAWLGLDGFQWLVSYNKGLQEYHYRADVGRYLAQISHPDASLLLEPTGYIPFFAGLQTYDEVGLVSPIVVTFRTQYGGDWYIEFLKQKHPTYLVEREYALAHLTVDNVKLSPADAAWFDQHYTLVKHFHYSPEAYVHSGWLLKLMKNGSHDDYYVYEARGQR